MLQKQRGEMGLGSEVQLGRNFLWHLLIPLRFRQIPRAEES